MKLLEIVTSDSALYQITWTNQILLAAFDFLHRSISITLPASTCMCDSEVVYDSLRMFPKYRERKRREFVQSNILNNGSIFWIMCR